MRRGVKLSYNIRPSARRSDEGRSRVCPLGVSALGVQARDCYPSSRRLMRRKTCWCTDLRAVNT